jgi:muconolactone D-isomerase
MNTDDHGASPVTGSAMARAVGAPAVREFLVEVDFTVPEGTDPGELEALRRAEAVRSAELARAGSLIRLWRPERPGWHNIGVWRATDEDDLETVMATLPLYSLMTVRVRPLRAHPNDPAGYTRDAGDPVSTP